MAVADNASAAPVTMAPRDGRPSSEAAAAMTIPVASELRQAEAKDVTPHGDQARDLELEPDDE